MIHLPDPPAQTSPNIPRADPRYPLAPTLLFYILGGGASTWILRYGDLTPADLTRGTEDTNTLPGWPRFLPQRNSESSQWCSNDNRHAKLNQS